MKKTELKNIIKECVKEVIFEEGVLSGIISEVTHGLGATVVIQERAQSPDNSAPQRSDSSRRKVLDEIGNNSYTKVKNKFKNPELFEGTKPIPTDKTQGSPLSGLDPNDGGLDISNIPGFGTWARVAGED